MLIILIFFIGWQETKDFSGSHVQLMGRCAGAGREHSRTASPSWPVEIFHTTDIVLSL